MCVHQQWSLLRPAGHKTIPQVRDNDDTQQLEAPIPFDLAMPVDPGEVEEEEIPATQLVPEDPKAWG